MGATRHWMTDGLVIRDYPTVAEKDRFIAILTRDKGVVRAVAKGAKSLKSRSGAGTQLLCYGKFSLIPGKDKYIVEDAKPLDVFFALREDVEKLALAQYFCELALHLAPTDANAEEHLRLLLNGLHFLAAGEREPLLIKAVVEMRLLCQEGYAPDLSGCSRCGKEAGDLFFSPVSGTLTCGACGAEQGALPLTDGVLSALRHIVDGAFERCFSFSLPAAELGKLADVTERFLLAQTQHTYATLAFFHTLYSPAQ